MVWDFFAGSGTTAQAVLEMNDTDDGNRQFIMATNNENNICKDSTYPRIQRVIEGYKFEGTEKEMSFEGKLNLTKLRKVDEIYTDYLKSRVNNEGSYNELKGEFKERIQDFDLSVSADVFSLGDFDFADEFSEMQDKVIVCSIPAVILRGYKRISR